MDGFVTVIQSPYLSWVSGPVPVQSRHILADWEFLFLFGVLFTIARSVTAVQILQPGLRYAGFDAQGSSHLAALGWKVLSRAILMLYAVVGCNSEPKSVPYQTANIFYVGSMVRKP